MPLCTQLQGPPYIQLLLVDLDASPGGPHPASQRAHMAHCGSCGEAAGSLPKQSYADAHWGLEWVPGDALFESDVLPPGPCTCMACAPSVATAFTASSGSVRRCPEVARSHIIIKPCARVGSSVCTQAFHVGDGTKQFKTLLYEERVRSSAGQPPPAPRGFSPAVNSRLATPVAGIPAVSAGWTLYLTPPHE